MPKYPFVISIPVLAASAFALCWLTPLPAFEASAEPGTENYSVSKQLFDPDVFGNVRSSFSRSVSTSDQPIVERRSIGRTTKFDEDTGADQRSGPGGIAMRAKIFNSEKRASVRQLAARLFDRLIRRCYGGQTLNQSRHTK